MRIHPHSKLSKDLILSPDAMAGVKMARDSTNTPRVMYNVHNKQKVEYP